MEILINLFWLPMNSIEFIINVGLWGLVGYLVVEGVTKYREKN